MLVLDRQYGKKRTWTLLKTVERWVAFLTDLAHITPTNSINAFVYGGANGLIFAAGAAAVNAKGHSISNFETSGAGGAGGGADAGGSVGVSRNDI